MSARLVGLMLGLAAAGCITSSAPKPASLDAQKASAVDLILVGGGSTFCAQGRRTQVKAVVRYPDGKTLETWSFGASRDGKLRFEDFEWNASLGAIDASGVLQVGANPFALLDQKVVLTVRVAERPDLVSELTVSPRFDCGGTLSMSGPSGQSGMSGQSGRQGRNGDSGNSSRQATDGEHGGNGQDGGDGADGGPGPSIEVALGYVDSKSHGRLVVARVSVAGRPGAGYLLLDASAGQRMVIAAAGGAGGAGGSGGSGGAGGFGGSNNVVDGGDGGNGGDGGDGGSGGSGGAGGDGGSILTRYDARFPELKTFAALINTGGRGGSAGRAGFAGTAGPGGSSASGKAGTRGRPGVAGRPGVSGRSGRDGPPVSYEAGPAAELFAAEIERGLPIVR